MKKRSLKNNSIIHVIGGGTVNHVRSHFAIAAMAYGQTARSINKNLRAKGLTTCLHLTKMASSGRSKLETNEDISLLIDEIIKDPKSCMVFFNAAVADFKGQVGDIPSGKYAARLRSREVGTGFSMTVSPSEKMLARIKQERPDIILIAFKTTTNDLQDEQKRRALALLKESGADLVLANDTGTRVNMIVTPDGGSFCVTTDRDEALKKLVAAACARMPS